MKSRMKIGFLATTVLLAYTPRLPAELLSEQEALRIARNYVSFITSDEGTWGGAKDAQVVSIEEFSGGGRTLGYFCRVAPQGYLVLSRHRELAPIRTYSTRCNLNLDLDEGMTDLIKGKMQRILVAIEQQLGAPIKPDDQLDDLLEINYRTISDALASETFRAENYRQPARFRDGAGMDYQEGEVLLPCNWHQQPPYNDQCPGMGCDWSAYGHFNYSARVGCVATAGAQVMYHWRWPPAGGNSPPFDDSYDWVNMCDEYIYDGAGWFFNEEELSVTWDQINAVAELCHEVGLAISMDYGCDGSSAYTSDLEDAFENLFYYHIDGAVVYRSDYESGVDWFNEIKQQVNTNRPCPYRIEEHAIVADGWKEELIEGDYYWYHMNYGWPNDSYDGWWALDELYHGGIDEEYLVANVKPDVSISYSLASNYTGYGQVRYFDRDVHGATAWFDPGHDLQILRPGFLLRNTGRPTDAISFNGVPGHATRFFFDGDIAGKTRIRVLNGHMKIRGGGEMAIILNRYSPSRDSSGLAL